MSSKLSSPTANLLRNSRLFSLPAALPRSTSETSAIAQSESATLPYPVQQAIITTPSSLARGDWGLKRQLPLKATTRSSTPTFRINAIDTREHITDFESAADLTIALQRIQELNLPVTQRASDSRYSRGHLRTSVFESKLDNTAPASIKKTNKVSSSSELGDELKERDVEASLKATKRWKYKGPWVSGMAKGDFEAYLVKELRQRREKFMAYLRKQFVEEVEAEGRKIDRMPDSNDGMTEQSTLSKQDTSDEAFFRFVKKLRGTYDLNSKLAQYIENFLDLPSLGNQGTFGLNSSISERGPPQGHPSAGLSYLRSDSHIENHPVLGPRARRTPVEGRVINPLRTMPTGAQRSEAKISVAGVVANILLQRDDWLPSHVPVLAESKTTEGRRRLKSQFRRLGVDSPGGHRGWVEPNYIGVTPKGRVTLGAASADSLTAAVHSGELVQSILADQKEKRPVAEPLFSIPEKSRQQLLQSQEVPGDAHTIRQDVAYEMVKSLNDNFRRNRANEDVGQSQ